MSGYVEKELQNFKKKRPSITQHQTYQQMVSVYGAKVKYSKPENSIQIITKEENIRVQQVIGTFLFYARDLYATILTALSDIASDKAAPT